MATIRLPLSATSGGIAHNVAFNANYDIVWSFQFNLSGTPGLSQGGFSTFLYDGAVPALTGGGYGKSLGYTSLSSYTVGGVDSVFDGVSGAVFGVGFDTTGEFGVSGNGVVTGLVDPIPNSFSYRSGSTFTYLTGMALSDVQSTLTLLTSTDDFTYIRFRLTDVGRTFEIATKDATSNGYVTIYSYATNLVPALTSTYKVGIAFTTPVTGNGGADTTFKIRNFHVEGNSNTPTSTSVSLISLSSYTTELLPATAAPTSEVPSIDLQEIVLYCTPTPTPTPSPTTDLCRTSYTDSLSSDSGTFEIALSGQFADVRTSPTPTPTPTSP